MRILIVAALALAPIAAIAATAPAKPVKAPKTVSLPAGPAMVKVKTACSGCHGLDQVTGAHKTPDQWEASVETMIDRGAKVADADFDGIVAYLAKNFGPAKR